MVSPAHLVLGSVLRASNGPVEAQSPVSRGMESSQALDTYDLNDDSDDKKKLLFAAGSMGGAMDPRCELVEIALLAARGLIVSGSLFGSAAFAFYKRDDGRADKALMRDLSLWSLLAVGISAYFERDLAKFYDEKCRPPFEKEEVFEGLPLVPISTQDHRTLTEPAFIYDPPLEQGFAEEAIIFAPFIAIGAATPVIAGFLAGAVIAAGEFLFANAPAVASTTALAPVIVNSLQDPEQKAKSR